MNLLNDFAKEFLSLMQKEYKQVDIIIDNNNFPIALSKEMSEWKQVLQEVCEFKLPLRI